MARVRYVAAALAAALTAAPISAQIGVRASTAADAESQESVVVRGQRKAVMQQLRNLIQRNKSDQLARFEEKVCPMVIGMPRDWTAKLTRMIRQNIESVGAMVDKPGCRPNGLVIFIDGAPELVRAFEKEEPTLLGDMHPREVANLLHAARPILSWHVTETMGADGEDLQTVSLSGGNKAKVTRSTFSSRLYTPARQDMLLAMTVIEKGQTEGKTLRQLADLATMHLLLEVKHDAGARDSSSILSLFEPRPAGTTMPARLSRFDRGALTGFYGQRTNNISSAQQRANIANAIEKDVGQGE